MPVSATTPEEIFIGAGDVYVDDVVVGATQDNNVFRVVQEKFAPDLNGVPGPLLNIDYIQSETAELEVTLPELSAVALGYGIPGAVSLAQSAAALDTAGGGSTTTAASAAAGATNIKVTAVTNFSVGDFVRIGPAGSTQEKHRILTVGTAGGGGTGIDLEHPLKYAQGNGVAFVEIDGGLVAADSAAGATNLKVSSVAGLAVDNFLMVGVQGEYEIRKIKTVGTTGAGGTGIDFYIPLARSHRTGDYTFEVTNEGETLITSGAGLSRRIPSSAYHKWELRVPGLDGREVRFTILKGIQTENAEFEAQDDGTLAPRLTVQARWDPASSSTSPWQITRIPAP